MLFLEFFLKLFIERLLRLQFACKLLNNLLGFWINIRWEGDSEFGESSLKILDFREEGEIFLLSFF